MNIPEAINQGKLALGQENRPILIAELVLQLGIEGLERTELLRNAINNGHSKENIYHFILSKLPSEEEK